MTARICLAVLFASSPWFSGTAVAEEVVTAWGWTAERLAWPTLAVQLGFLAGTLVASATNLADRFPAPRVFWVSALLAALSNLLFALAPDPIMALAARGLCGMSLAGVYPVGMKILASHGHDGLPLRISLLVGALSLGTAAPYAIAMFVDPGHWRELIIAASLLAFFGAFLAATTRLGKSLPPARQWQLSQSWAVFRDRKFRAQAIGYFGHMWELYAFWAFVGPWLVQAGHEHATMLAFGTIGLGAAGCPLGGLASRRWGPAAVAKTTVALSGAMCLLSPWLFDAPDVILIPALVAWGMAVVADSPHYSALAARHAPPAFVGTALSVQNGLGFGLTLVSIAALPEIADQVGWRWSFLFLAPGPLVALLAMRSFPMERPR